MRWELLACCCMAWGLVEAKLEEERKRSFGQRVERLLSLLLGGQQTDCQMYTRPPPSTLPIPKPLKR